MHFAVVQGDIARQTAHGVVNTTGSNCRMECGVAGVLRQRSNGPIAADAAQHEPLRCGDVVVTEAYDLAALYLLHAIPIAQDGSATEHGIQTATQMALQRADELGCRSLVIPLLGCGGGGYDLNTGAALVCKEIWQFDPASLADVRVISHTQDDFDRLQRIAQNIKAQPRQPGV